MELVSQSKLAEMLGVSQPAISMAVKAGRISYADPKRKLFDTVAATAQWAANREKERAPTRAPHDAPEAELRRRRLLAQTVIAEREANADQGELVALVAIERALGHFDGLLKSAVQGVGSRLEGELRAHLPGQIQDTLGLRAMLVSYELGIIYGVHHILRQALTQERIRVAAAGDG